MNYINDETKQMAIDVLRTTLWKAATRLRADADPTRENRREAFVAWRSWARADIRLDRAVGELAAELRRMDVPVERPPERLVREDTPAL